MDEKIKVALILSLLSPFIAEVITGSTPILTAINPLVFIFLWAYYGAGVVLMREAWIRWGGNFTRLMLLGFSYGVIEEGICIKTWFDPHWKDLGTLAYYGRIAGINTVWAVWLTIIHSMLSIVSPIIIISTFYPEYKNRPLLNKKGLILAAISFTVSGAILFLFLNPYTPPIPQYFIAIIVVIVMIMYAKKISREILPHIKLGKKHPFIHGFIITVLLFIVFAIFPKTPVPFPLTITVGIILVLMFYSTMPGLTDKKLFLLIFGALSFWMIPYDIILELNHVLFMSLTGIVAWTVLYLKYRKRFSHKECNQRYQQNNEPQRIW